MAKQLGKFGLFEAFKFDAVLFEEIPAALDHRCSLSRTSRSFGCVKGMPTKTFGTQCLISDLGRSIAPESLKATELFKVEGGSHLGTAEVHEDCVAVTSISSELMNHVAKKEIPRPLPSLTWLPSELMKECFDLSVPWRAGGR